MDDTAPMDVVDRPGPEQRVPAERPESDEIALMRGKLATAQDKVTLQREQAWLDVLSDKEVKSERRAVEDLRTADRKQRKRSGQSAIKRRGRERRFNEQMADIGQNTELWKRRALARRERLLDPSSRLATLYRTQVACSWVLRLLAFAGITWTATGVHDALVGAGGNPLAYIVEPLASLPFLVLMTMHSAAALWGRQFPERHQKVWVYLLEFGLASAIMVINVSPVVAGLGVWQGTPTFLAHLLPPALIAVAVVLQSLASSFFSNLLTSAYVEADPEGKRLAPETVDTISLVAKIRADVDAGELALAEDGYPSISQIQRRYGIAKQRAQGASDALRMLSSS